MSFFSLASDVPSWVISVYLVTLLIIALSIISQIALILTSLFLQSTSGAPLHRKANTETSESDYLWVFLVPALNEEMTIADSVSRLVSVEATNKIILVINDGSDDRTGDVLEALKAKHPELLVLTRTLPLAQRGKAEALNDAWSWLRRSLAEPNSPYSKFDEAHTILGIVDADGRLDAKAPAAVAPHFAHPHVGGVQLRVRIYNRRHPLTWIQDVEFAVFGWVFQLGRTGWGSANMGGNGQFNRLAALNDIAPSTGPWDDRLTEDQDLGVRLIQQGWYGRQENSAVVSQQGVSSLRRLFRQRVRWSQGAVQAIPLVLKVPSAPISVAGKLDQAWYLITPLIQLVVGFSVVVSVAVAVVYDTFAHTAALLWLLTYAMAFVPGFFAILVSLRGRGLIGILFAVFTAHVFIIYWWLIFPVVYTAAIRQLFGVKSWTKTAREPIKDGSTPLMLPALQDVPVMASITTLPTHESAPKLIPGQAATA